MRTNFLASAEVSLADQLRLVYRRPIAHDSVSLSNLNENSTKSTLGNKLQILAWVAPTKLHTIEVIVDHMLRRLNDDGTKVVLLLVLLST